MSNEEASSGWVLYSQAQGRRFGPLSEDELRQYFRAGMVKSVDRLSAPGESQRRPAADVAQQLGESVPVGPPPPELVESPSPPPRPTVGTPNPESESDGEARAARAAAAMNIDLAALMSSTTPKKRDSNLWMVGVAIVALVGSLFVALNMLRKMPAGGRPPVAREQPVATTGDGNGNGSVPDYQLPPADGGPRTAIAATQPPAPSENPIFETRRAQAHDLQANQDWQGLAAMAESWSREQPDRTEPLQYLGAAHVALGRIELAAESYEKILAREPNHPVKRDLADLWLQAQRPDRAATLYKEMVATTGNDARLWNNYGAALNASGQPAQAAAALETAVKLDPSLKQAWTNLGNVYQGMGDQARASAAFANSR